MCCVGLGHTHCPQGGDVAGEVLRVWGWPAGCAMEQRVSVWALRQTQACILTAASCCTTEANCWPSLSSVFPFMLPSPLGGLLRASLYDDDTPASVEAASLSAAPPTPFPVREPLGNASPMGQPGWGRPEERRRQQGRAWVHTCALAAPEPLVLSAQQCGSPRPGHP